MNKETEPKPMNNGKDNGKKERLRRDYFRFYEEDIVLLRETLKKNPELRESVADESLKLLCALYRDRKFNKDFKKQFQKLSGIYNEASGYLRNLEHTRLYRGEFKRISHRDIEQSRRNEEDEELEFPLQVGHYFECMGTDFLLQHQERLGTIEECLGVLEEIALEEQRIAEQGENGNSNRTIFNNQNFTHLYELVLTRVLLEEKYKGVSRYRGVLDRIDETAEKTIFSLKEKCKGESLVNQMRILGGKIKSRVRPVYHLNPRLGFIQVQ